jgi:hypothetical protein
MIKIGHDKSAILRLRNGDKIDCNLMGADVKSAEVLIDDAGRVFVCQDVVGLERPSLQGQRKKYAWLVYDPLQGLSPYDWGLVLWERVSKKTYA